MNNAFEALKSPEGLLSSEKAKLPTAPDLQSEYASLIGKNVLLAMPRPGHSSYSVSGELTAVLKGLNGDLVLKVDSGTMIHFVAQSKISELRAGK